MYFKLQNHVKRICVVLAAPAALGWLLHREQVLDGFTTKEDIPVQFCQRCG